MTLSIREVIDANIRDGKVYPSRMERQLIDRENNMADMLRLAGQQFGLYPEIVAEVLASVGMGTQPSPEERQLIRNNFVALMERLRNDGV